MTIPNFTQQHIDKFLESLDDQEPASWYGTDYEITHSFFNRFIK